MSESFLGHELRGAWKSDESPTCPHNREGITGCGECIDAMYAERDGLKDRAAHLHDLLNRAHPYVSYSTELHHRIEHALEEARDE